MNHTKEKWIYRSFGEIQLGNDPKPTETFIIENREDAHTVAIVPFYCPGKQAEAHARLIAAAPDLLATLEEIKTLSQDRIANQLFLLEKIDEIVTETIVKARAIKAAEVSK